MGAEMGFLYDDLITDCTKRLSGQQIKVKVNQKKEAEFIYEIVPSEKGPVDEKELEELKPTCLGLKADSTETFLTLFTKSEARCSIQWAAFEAAMVDLGFSVKSEYGSVYTFAPSDKLAPERSIKIHRPHKCRIEGHKLLFIARIPNRTYGWTQDTVHVA
ncbi:uncharacterized protein GGS22DRAFT_192762 [Annulohypoxylon maeteangense]|uniref:uncharacterized protein n=1 Tax=Annulohypoxylon maeteangense TaxID=1927788 RepID=UPI002008B63F|nr:uncharacterized protein GGS22DRAFT_192762 [Annulohypoxylon maeteangense]KAI0880925.1 hypothetical protein GGS22DRAFT_192762 [Annulohypoxylon maeteangense]